MNTTQQDNLTHRRITVWEKLFERGHGNHHPTTDPLSADERKLFDELTATLYNDLVPRQRSTTPTPDGPLTHITVAEALTFAMHELCGNNATHFRPINAAGGPITTLPRHRVEEIIEVALKSVCHPPQP